MINLSVILLVLIVLFVMFLILRSVTKLKFCALCAAVSTTWIVLLTLLYTGKDIDPIIISILMGGSSVGLMYYLEKRLSEKYRIFKFPFLITLFLLIYLLLADGINNSRFYIDLTSIWAVFIAIYFLRDKKGLKNAAQKIIECCKNW